MGFLCALSFLTYFDRVCIMRSQDQIQGDLAIDDFRIGCVMGAFWLAYALFEIPSGWFGDRVGPRYTLTRIVLAWSLFTALSGTAVGFLSLLLFRFLFGMGEAGAYPNMARVQAQWLPLRARARAGGLLWLTARWGGAFSPLIFGTMLRAFDSTAFRETAGGVPGLSNLADIASWRLCFWAAGLVGVLWCLAFYPWFRDNPADKRSVNHAERALIAAGRPSESHEPKLGADGWRRLFSCPSLWAISILYLCGSFGWSFFVSWMPRFLKDVHGISFEQSEWTSALPLLCGGVSCLVGGVLSDWLVRRTGWRRWGRAIFPLAGCSTAAAAMFAIPFVDTHQQAVALMCLASAAFDFGQAANWATIVDIGGEFAGTATGFVNMVGNMGNAVQPAVGSVIFRALGWNTLFFVLSGAFLCAASMWMWIDPRRTFYDVAGSSKRLLAEP